MTVKKAKADEIESRARRGDAPMARIEAGRRGRDGSKQSREVPINIVPGEWDFRPVERRVLRDAILYEYARSADWIVEKFREWHKQRISLPEQSEDFQKWNGLTIGKVVKCANRGGLPDDVMNALNESNPDWTGEDPFDDLHRISIAFPLPFVLLHQVDTLFRTVDSGNRGCGSVWSPLQQRQSVSERFDGPDQESLGAIQTPS
jgi:hypothetical protein